jgi:polysaccharide export outer membrane protein
MRWMLLCFVLLAGPVLAQSTYPGPSGSGGGPADASSSYPAARGSGTPSGSQATAGTASRVSGGDGMAALPPMAVLGEDYKIGPNDLMDVEVFGVADLRRSVRVNASGYVTLPLIGQTKLMGLTAQQAEVLIAQKYAEKYLQNPEVSVFIREYTTRRITIDGAVARPGIFPVTGDMTLLRAIAMAGGGGNLASLDNVKVFRIEKGGERKTLLFNVDKIRSGEQADPDIQPDDVIVVSRDPARVGLKDSLFRDIIDSINPFSVLAPK